MRSLWKGSVSFGLVTIPVKLYAATERKDVSFNYLHRACGTPIRYQKVCPACDREVAMDEIVRGYEYEKGRFVLLDDEDFADLPTPERRTVEILDFVRLDEIDPVYYNRTYYLEPGEGGVKAYHLLRRAMATAGRVAVGRVALRAKESLAVLRVYGRSALCLETMYYPDEVRSTEGLVGLGAEPALKDQELSMAIGLIESLSAPFAAEKYTAQYRGQLLERIAAKVAGREVIEAGAPAETGKVIDLMEALRASLAQAEAERAAPAPDRAETRA